jgi:hypothetical protein
MIEHTQVSLMAWMGHLRLHFLEGKRGQEIRNKIEIAVTCVVQVSIPQKELTLHEQQTT